MHIQAIEKDRKMTDWYFDCYGNDGEIQTFGPYDTKDEAKLDLIRVKVEKVRLNDLTERYYSMPYDDSVVPFKEITE